MSKREHEGQTVKAGDKEQPHPPVDVPFSRDIVSAIAADVADDLRELSMKKAALAGTIKYLESELQRTADERDAAIKHSEDLQQELDAVRAQVEGLRAELNSQVTVAEPEVVEHDAPSD